MGPGGNGVAGRAGPGGAGRGGAAGRVGPGGGGGGGGRGRVGGPGGQDGVESLSWWAGMGLWVVMFVRDTCVRNNERAPNRGA